MNIKLSKENQQKVLKFIEQLKAEKKKQSKQNDKVDIKPSK